MADMRVAIAGAGGPMGRTLIHAIAATKGLTLAGAVDGPGSAVIGRDAGELAGLGANGVKVTADVDSGSFSHPTVQRNGPLPPKTDSAHVGSTAFVAAYVGRTVANCCH
jgi:predicted dehydrogenase